MYSFLIPVVALFGKLVFQLTLNVAEVFLVDDVFADKLIPQVVLAEDVYVPLVICWWVVAMVLDEFEASADEADPGELLPLEICPSVVMRTAAGVVVSLSAKLVAETVVVVVAGRVVVDVVPLLAVDGWAVVVELVVTLKFDDADEDAKAVVVSGDVVVVEILCGIEATGVAEGVEVSVLLMVVNDEDSVVNVADAVVVEDFEDDVDDTFEVDFEVVVETDVDFADEEAMVKFVVENAVVDTGDVEMELVAEGVVRGAVRVLEVLKVVVDVVPFAGDELVGGGVVEDSVVMAVVGEVMDATEVVEVGIDVAVVVEVEVEDAAVDDTVGEEALVKVVDEDKTVDFGEVE